MQLDKYEKQTEQDLLILLRSQEMIGKTQRVGFTLPRLIVKILNKISKPGEKSRFVTEAIAEKITKEQREKHFQKLSDEYAKLAKKEAKIAEEWFSLEEEAQGLYEKEANKKTPKKR